MQVQRLFETEMPRDAAANRVKNRCVLTGRSRSVHRFARLSRIMVRQLAHLGLLPGVSKASWWSGNSGSPAQVLDRTCHWACTGRMAM